MTAPMYFLYPFGVSGDRVAVPALTQGDGTVSYQQGYGPDYSLDPNTNPDAINIERTKMNEVFYQATLALQYIEQHGVFDFISSAMNGGSPYTYVKGDRVRYNNGTTIEIYQSLINANTDLPTVATSWQLVTIISQANVQPSYASETAAGGFNLDGTITLIGINKASGAATAISLLDSAKILGLRYTVVDEKGDAATNNITITPASGTIGGNANYVISVNDDSVTFYWNGTEFKLI